MAEYIDREKALKILENSLNFSKTELNTAHKQFQKGCISAIEDDIGNISHMPTEDVVPRSEVDKWKANCEQLHKEMSERMVEERKIERKLAKQEVAREIFEEIESFIESDRGKVICEDNSNDWFAKDRAKTFETYHNIGVENAKNTLRDFLDELKKKYIGV